MESTYGIAVTNKFDLFIDEDADPLEILRMQEEAKSRKKEGKAKKDDPKPKDQKTNKSKPKPNTQQSSPTEKPKSTEDKENRREQTDNKPPRNKSRQNDNREFNRDDRPNRPPRERDQPPRRRDNRERRDNRDNRDRQSTDAGVTDRNDFANSGDNRPMGFRGGFNDRSGGGGFGQSYDSRPDRPESSRGNRGRGGRGRGRGRGGFDRFGKREFDRHSGSDKTGVKASDKRDGGGAHNWGTYETDLADTVNKDQIKENVEAGDYVAPADDSDVKDASEKTEQEAGDDGDKDAEPEPIDEGPKEMTLDEYRALQTALCPTKKPEFNIRKAGEGVDDKQWKKMYVLPKKPKEEDEEEYEYDDEEDHRKQKKMANNLIEITFADAPRRGGRGRSRGGGMDRGGRGSRGRGRGGRDGGGFRGGRDGGNSYRGPRREQAPCITDDMDFPSLSH